MLATRLTAWLRPALTVTATAAVAVLPAASRATTETVCGDPSAIADVSHGIE